jgi:outer membrane protein assembly factor BamB
MTHHLTNDQLNSYLHQTLTDAEREALDRHLAECPVCRARLDGHEALQRRIRYGLATELRGVQPSPRMRFVTIAPRLKRSRRFTRVLKQSNQFAYGTLTIALLIAVGAGLYLFLSNLSWPTPTAPEEVKQPTIATTVVSQPEVKPTAAVSQPTIGSVLAGELKWKFNAGSRLTVSLTVADGMVYFSTNDRYFHAVDSQTGQEKWKFETDGPAYSMPVVADGLVYFGNGDSLTVLDSQTGQEKWRFKTGLGVRSAPAVAEGVVYFGSDDRYFYAVDAQTGQELWKFKTGDRVQGSPTVAENLVYFGSYDGYFYALDRHTGQEQWKFKTGLAGLNKYPATAVEGMIYLGDFGRLRALDSHTGQEKWQVEIAGEYALLPSRLIADGMVYAYGTRGLYALDSQTGQEKWRAELSNPLPTLAEGVLYAGNNNDGYVVALDSQTGQELWKFKTDYSECYFPVVANGVVYFGGRDSSIYAVWAEPQT